MTQSKHEQLETTPGGPRPTGSLEHDLMLLYGATVPVLTFDAANVAAAVQPRQLSLRRTLSAAGLAAGLLAVAGAVAAANLLSAAGPSSALAQELADRSVQQFQQLSAVERAELGFSIDSERLLEEARTAPDLELLTYDEVKHLLPGSGAPAGAVQSIVGPGAGVKQSTAPGDGSGTIAQSSEPLPPTMSSMTLHRNGEPPATVSLEDAAFLRFTSSEGATVIIALDPEAKPLFILVQGEAR